MTAEPCGSPSGRGSVVGAGKPVVMSDRISDESPQLPLYVLKRFLSILSDLIFHSSVDPGNAQLCGRSSGSEHAPATFSQGGLNQCQNENYLCASIVNS